MSNLLKCFRDIIAVVAIVIVAFVVSGLVVRAVDIANGDVRFLVSYVVPMTIMLVGILLYKWLVIKPKELTMCSIRGLNPTVHIWGLLLLIALAIVLLPLMQLLPSEPRDIPSGVWGVVTLIFVAPIFEELIFRAGIFSIVSDTCRPTVSALVSSLLFGVMHGEVAVAIEAFLAGMIFSYAYILTQSIVAPIILHIFNNIVAYVLLQFTYQDYTINDLVLSLESFDIIYAISLAVLMLGIVHIAVIYRRADELIKEGKTLRDMAPDKGIEKE
ncbi:MAG: CPBP family intramembrane metalloprotease [Alistipes sp.]|nr:CPBP family intramembrane metalloprotease [Alistipes sp.]